MAKETKYEVVRGNVLKSFSNNEETSLKVELTTEKPMDFLKYAYSEVRSDRFLPEILTKEDCKELSFHSKFSIPTKVKNGDNINAGTIGDNIDAGTIGEGSFISVKLKSNGNGMYPVAILVFRLVEKEPYNPFDFD